MRVVTSLCAGDVLVRFPYPFLHDFYDEFSELVDEKHRQHLSKLVFSAVHQPDTFPGVGFQFAAALELTRADSKLWASVLKPWPDLRVNNRVRLPVSFFNVPSELPEGSFDTVFSVRLLGAMMSVSDDCVQVVDQKSDEKRLFDVAWQAVAADGSRVTVGCEAKRVKDPVKLRRQAVDFFELCQKRNKPRERYLFLSYYSLQLPDAPSPGSNIQFLQGLKAGGQFQIVDGADKFDACRIPFGSLFDDVRSNADLLDVWENVRDLCDEVS